MERKWVAAYGGSERTIDTYRDIIGGIFFAPEYSWLDGLRLVKGNSLSPRAIRPQTENTDLSATVPELKVPVYFMMGRYDYMTPAAVAHRYYERLIAPDKRFIWFENSAHAPHFEEPEAFAVQMISIKSALH